MANRTPVARLILGCCLAAALPLSAQTSPPAAPRVRPGLQPVEPDPAAGQKPQSVEPPAEEKPKPGVPLPPAPNALPNDLPAGDLTQATSLAPPEKVESRVPYQPDPVPPAAHPLATSPIPIRPLDTRDAVFESPAGILFTSPEFLQAFVPHRDRSPDAAADLYYDRYDLATGQRTGGFAVPPGSRVLDLSPDGTRLLACWTSPDSTGVTDDCLGLFVVTNDRLTLRTAWRPYVSLRAQTTRGVDRAYLVDNTHVLTSMGSDIVLWDIDNNRALYRLYPAAPCKPALTPGRKYVAVVSGSTPWLLDVTTGQPAVKLNGTLPAPGPLSVRPDAKQLACLLEDRLLVWDVDKADLISDTALSLPNAAAATTMDWVSDGYVLINNRYLVDVARQIVLWDYVPEENGVGGQLAGQYWYSVPSAKLGGRVLAHLQLPHEGAAHEASQIDPATVMAVKPGAKVSIDLSRLDAGDTLKARSVAALTAKLQANGVEVADNQLLKLVVTSAPGEIREVTYRSPSTGEATTVNVPEDLVTVSFLDNGKTAWQTTRPATPPGTLALRPGQSVEDFLAAERARLRLVTAAQVTLPKFVPHPRKTPFYGRSILTEGDPRYAGQ